MGNQTLVGLLEKHRNALHPVIKFANGLARLDLGVGNKKLTNNIFADTQLFQAFIEEELASAGVAFGYGGYLEDRQVYNRSSLFSGEDERRTIHLGIDTWGKVGTPIYSPLPGQIHSVKNNDHFGDYGATVIVQYELDGFVFHALFGHLSFADLARKRGELTAAGDVIGHFGPPAENGNWPPHLHFQLVIDMEGQEGDYPGVAAKTRLDHYRSNCPNPASILQLPGYAS